MARGITETDVWSACDALLLEGARPTIERVRQKIGRGSPNTVSPCLDTWFRHLGGRIKDPGAFAAPPGLPDPIRQAAQHFWEAALAETRRDFDQRLGQALAAAVANVDAEKDRAAVAEAAAFEASSKALRLQAELAERSSRLDQQSLARAAGEAHLGDARRQVDELRLRLERAASELAEVREHCRRDVAAALERSVAAERRAALEIDAERSARARADQRAEALERKLEQAQSAARAERVRDGESIGRLGAQLQAAQHELGRTRLEGTAAAVRVAALEDALGAASRRADRAQAEATIARDLFTKLKPKAGATRKPPDPR